MADSGYAPHIEPVEGRFHYSFALDMRTNWPPTRFTLIPPHNYSAYAEDICVEFGGAAMGPAFPHRSPSFRIPYASIAEALTRAGLPAAPIP